MGNRLKVSHLTNSFVKITERSVSEGFLSIVSKEGHNYEVSVLRSMNKYAQKS